MGACRYTARTCYCFRLCPVAGPGPSGGGELPAGVGRRRARKERLFGIRATGWESWPGRRCHWPATLLIATHAASDYLSVLEQEVSGIVQALRSHPSLITWCGGNELDLEHERVPLACIADCGRRKRCNPSILAGIALRWRHTSMEHLAWPGTVVGFRPPERSLRERIRLPGFARLPPIVAEMFIQGAPSTLADPRWVDRKAQVAKLLHYAGPAATGDLPEAILLTQRIQAAALQAGVKNIAVCGGTAVAASSSGSSMSPGLP